MTMQAETPTGTRNDLPGAERQEGDDRPKKVGLLAGVVYIAGFVVLLIAYGLSGTKNEEFNIVQPFHVTAGSRSPGRSRSTKASSTSCSRRDHHRHHAGGGQKHADPAQPDPDGGRVALRPVRAMTRDTMDEQMTKKWFPLVGTLFVFILVTNLSATFRCPSTRPRR